MARHWVNSCCKYSQAIQENSPPSSTSWLRNVYTYSLLTHRMLLLSNPVLCQSMYTVSEQREPLFVLNFSTTNALTFIAQLMFLQFLYSFFFSITSHSRRLCYSFFFSIGDALTGLFRHFFVFFLSVHMSSHPYWPSACMRFKGYST